MKTYTVIYTRCLLLRLDTYFHLKSYSLHYTTTTTKYLNKTEMDKPVERLGVSLNFKFHGG